MPVADQQDLQPDAHNEYAGADRSERDKARIQRAQRPAVVAFVARVPAARARVRVLGGAWPEIRDWHSTLRRAVEALGSGYATGRARTIADVRVSCIALING